ncbi:MAG TPA: DUF4139 domain-containing protein [Candidatus Baltobacteraceae bacterium]|nr:DUF4139 domain-containing protein [Candidatus Baltobacteraceae bacterium]
MRTIALVGTFLFMLAAVSESAPLPRSAVTQDQQKEVSLTVYNGNLGLIRDLREVQLPVGTHEIRFMDVASQIDPTTVHLKSLTDPHGVRILEQNYEYDLLSPQKLMEKYVGRKVTLVKDDGEEIEAVLLSTQNGPVYQIDGKIYLGYPGRVVLPDLPADLIPNPTLVWLLESGISGPQQVEVSYLTSGLTWKADYVVVLNEKDTGGDLSGWVTIDNKSGATYRDAALKLVAGDLHRAPTRRELQGAMEMASKAAAAPTQFQEESLFEYHLYSLQGRTTVKNNQMKQISLLDAPNIPIRKEFRFVGASQYYRSQLGTPISNQKVGVFLEIENTEKRNLGLPLPKGTVRVYKASSDKSLEFVGEDVIDHTPKDEKVKIKMGEAFDVVGERTQRDWKRIATNVYETEWDVQIRNHKSEDVDVTIVEPVPGDWEIVKSSHPFQKAEAHTLQFVVHVPRDGKVTVNYRVRMRW